MLAENLENLLRNARLEGFREGRLEGRLEVRQEEARRILFKLIGLKFGGLPEWAQKRLDDATPDQLEDWTAAILVADSLGSLLSEH